MKRFFECSHCGVISEVPAHLCEPRGLSYKHQYCGSTTEGGHICQPMEKNLGFVCGKCGRPAEQADLICDPLVLGR